jgi:hypothetical protein
MRPYHQIEDPRQSPPEVDECDQCGWEKATNPDCPECLRVAAIREDAAVERGRREPEY